VHHSFTALITNHLPSPLPLMLLLLLMMMMLMYVVGGFPHAVAMSWTNLPTYTAVAADQFNCIYALLEYLT